MFKYLVWLSCLSLLFGSCANKDDKNLISGTELTGDKMVDALVLSVLAIPPCQYLTAANSSSPFVLGEGSISICSVQAVNGSIVVQATGNYQVTANSGRQTLSSSGCTASVFDYHIALKDGNTELFSSGLSVNKQLTLESGKSYTLESSGLVDASKYNCQGRGVSSSNTPYRFNLRKL
ncbi:hypothetical protein EHQ68_09375 [Leptospira congkakensis]|uniref:Lipoprotein n=1 Tax=Leptospira congkakensis TaxID=2484932 RepID=A0A4Z1A9F5_9LEPT|nr:hypothetical protein [Leptospira congkakensis]TGL85967.1 hypothetical protein EHQ69_17970 [Leptospira congkakensis]TGL88840.1 hypothetical protein EHQ68_09375 [Leptospira congkakensis]TGL93345.1 hypothetical protein EHQ70_17540 [Leptospira congkakensis]